MSDAHGSEITRIMHSVQAGDRQAASQLLPLVYDELRRLAHQRMAAEPADHTLQATALVHEAYLRLVGDADAANWDSRGHFFAAAARAMRRILIERARRHAAAKHGGGRQRVSFNRIDDEPDDETGVDLIALDEALTRLESEDPRLSQIIMLRYFAGLTVDQTAQHLGVSSRTVKRDWTVARAWLYHEIMREGGQPAPEDV
ncbi:MAG: sigma-70 family RNA polymerase sigma factor [Phycisphaerales bacterium]|nr:sigma-70 family RNA polymerase sigma factor [Phycisphaerales bacterium]